MKVVNKLSHNTGQLSAFKTERARCFYLSPKVPKPGVYRICRKQKRKHKIICACVSNLYSNNFIDGIVLVFSLRLGWKQNEIIGRVAHYSKKPADA